MSDYISFIRKEEEAHICSEICGKYVLLIFDGTCMLGEALAIIIRYISDEWSIE